MTASTDFTNERFAEYLDWRVDHPSDDIMTELLHAEFEDTTGTTRTLTREEILIYTSVVAGAGNETTTKLIGWAGRCSPSTPTSAGSSSTIGSSSPPQSRSCCATNRRAR